jgi:hypothetical protein
MTDFYTYLYRDIDRTPIYVGKGKGNRAYVHFNGDTHLSNLLRKRLKDGYKIEPEINYHINEEWAFAIEMCLIQSYGRADLKTGTLFNLTNGGEGPSGRPPANKGKKGMQVPWNKGTKDFKNGPYKKITCPHCGKVGAGGAMKLHHFDNCDTMNPLAKIKNKHSEASCKNQGRTLSKVLKDKPQRKVTCPHCGKIGGAPSMTRYHLDNCNKKTILLVSGSA